jgi:hypothetical protein
MTTTNARDRGREAFERQAWAEAYAQLSTADREMPLEVEDLEWLAVAAYLTGQDSHSADIWAQVHSQCLRLGHAP